MLTRYDEMFCHQVVSTFDRPGTSAREWTERAWMMTHDFDGEFHLAAGFGYYPNRNIMDAFGTLVLGNKTQYYLRASRELRPDIDVFHVGPFSYEMLEPLKKIRYVLADNEFDFSFDITVEGVYPPLEEDPGQFQISRGRLKEDIKRFVQIGKPSGWIRAGGKTYELGKYRCMSERDRSWGIRISGAERVETGTQPHEVPAGSLFNFELMQFQTWAASYHIREEWDEKLGKPQTWHFGGGLVYPYGSGKEPQKLVHVEHDFDFYRDPPERRRFKSGRVILHAIDGSRKEVSIRPVSICLQSPGGYGIFRGFIHGLWKGPFWIDGGKLDLNDPQVMRELWGYCDYGSVFSCDGETGYGTTELGVSGKYPRYGYQGYGI